MKSLLVCIALLGMNTVFAQEAKMVKFGYYNSNAYYSCNYAEYQASMYLAKLGGRDVMTDCRGGIEPGPQFLPINMNVSYRQIAQEKTKEVVFKGRESCDFNVKLIDSILTTFDNLKVEKHNTCFNSQGSYYYKIQWQ